MDSGIVAVMVASPTALAVMVVPLSVMYSSPDLMVYVTVFLAASGVMVASIVACFSISKEMFAIEIVAVRRS